MTVLYENCCCKIVSGLFCWYLGLPTCHLSPLYRDVPFSGPSVPHPVVGLLLIGTPVAVFMLGAQNTALNGTAVFCTFAEVKFVTESASQSRICN